MMRKRNNFNNYFFSDGHQIFGMTSILPCSDETKVIAYGINTASFSDEFTVGSVKSPILKASIIKRKDEPLIERYIDACNTHDKKEYDEVMQKLREKYYYPFKK